jgi:hypothetical protein
MSLLPDRMTGKDGFYLFVAKFITTIIMHLVTFKYWRNGLNIMKYSNNHPQKFFNPSICFVLGFW